MLIQDLTTLDQFKDVLNIDPHRLERTKELGGASGGSCWGDEPQNYTCHEEMEPDTVLQEILEAVFPSLTFLEYQRLAMSPIYEKRNYSRTEYYGNWSEYEKHTLMLDELYKALREIWQKRQISC